MFVIVFKLVKIWMENVNVKVKKNWRRMKKEGEGEGEEDKGIGGEEGEWIS